MSERNHVWNVSVAMTPALVDALKQQASHTTLRDVYETAAKEFLKRRDAGPVQYQPAPKDSRQKTVWLCRSLYESVRQAAEADKMTISDFLATAFTDYCTTKGAL